MNDARSVRIVTDSTADLPHDLAQSLRISIVPLSITIGTQTFRDGVDLSPEEFLSKLETSHILPKTSQPPVSAFEQVFQAALARDEDVLCLTISADLSGTHNAARLAAQATNPDRVHVIDTRATTMQQGLAVIAVARVAGTNAPLPAVIAEAHAAIQRTRLFAVLKTLDYVYKGGRIGRAAQLVGTALAIKPVLSLVDGILVPVERVRTWNKALARTTELIAALPTPTDIAVVHSGNLREAEATAVALGNVFPDARVTVGAVGATITTYAGPGAVGIAALLPE